MRTPSPDDAKTQALLASGTLHPEPEAVKDELFAQHEFFDPRDQVQVKYEMVRRHLLDGKPVTDTAKLFGVSRQAYYQTHAAFETQGIAGLLPRRRGPKGAHKCTEEILDFVEEWRRKSPEGTDQTLAQSLKERFGVTIHPRTIDRALAKKKRFQRRAR
jgi:transposase